MNSHALEMLRYGINGIVATAVHYAMLTFNLQVLLIPSAGLANLFAAIFGISTSFIGSRYFVFHALSEGIWAQASKFATLYGVFALVHGVVLLILTDMLGYDYRFGFVFATTLQMTGSYLGNKFLVFKK